MPNQPYNHHTTEIGNIKDFITVAYVIIDDIYKAEVPAYIQNRRNINCSKLSDSEIITISIVGELLTIDSEKAWFSFCKANFNDLFPRLCERSRFNRTRRNLFKVIELIRNQLTELLGFNQNRYRIVDSMPIHVCHFGRAHFHKSLKEYSSYGRCASKKETYYGMKLHLLVTLDGYVTDYLISKANIDDRAALWELIAPYNSNTILGDKGYIGEETCNQLLNEKGVLLIPLQRENSKNQYPTVLRREIFKRRRRIETTGSQLACQLNIEEILARTIWGAITRIRTKLLAFDLCCYINKVSLGKEKFTLIKELVFG